MPFLILVSLIWALSFGLIKHHLVGLNPFFIAWFRLLLCFLFFLPFLRQQGLRIREVLYLILLGSVQFGLMYVLYIHAYAYLMSYEIAMLTIVTPLYVVLFDSLIQRTFKWRYFGSALGALLGSWLIVNKTWTSSGAVIGICLMQGSNASFALGQVFYRHLFMKSSTPQHRVFGWMYLGALIVASIFAVLNHAVSLSGPSASQWVVLFYLGLIASGLCFFLWNWGACKVNSGTLSVMNNLKIPLAILFSIFIFNEQVSVLRLALGSLMILVSLWISRPRMH
jgi:drug/metabolite transporter (DMT)-like permease